MAGGRRDAAVLGATQGFDRPVGHLEQGGLDAHDLLGTCITLVLVHRGKCFGCLDGAHLVPLVGGQVKNLKMDAPAVFLGAGRANESVVQ